MVGKRKIGWLYLLILWALISVLAWPAYIMCSTALAFYGGEGWQLDAWNSLPFSELVRHFTSGYAASAVFAAPVGLVAVADYLLLSRYKATWLIGGIFLPLTGMAIAFAFYKQPAAALPALAATGVVLAIIHRSIDIIAGSDSRGRLR